MSAFCESCGLEAADDAVFCDGCGAPIDRPAPVPAGAAQAPAGEAATATLQRTAVLPPVSEPTPAPDRPGPGRRPRAPRRGIVAGAVALLVVAGAAAGVYFGVVEPDSKPVPATASLPPLPARDLARLAGSSPISGLGKLPGSVIVATGGDPESTTPADAPYLILATRSDLGVVCGQIDRLWLSRLHDDGYEVSPERTNALAGFVRKGECSFGETLPAESEGPTQTYTADVFARRLTAADPRLRAAVAHGGTLDGLGPAPARAFRGPYTEVQLSLAMPDGLNAGGTSAAGNDGLSDRAVVRRVATIIALSARGRAASGRGDFARAAANREKTQARAEALLAEAGSDVSGDLRLALRRLRAAAHASVVAVHSFQACGSVACAGPENDAATAAKRRFIAAFNPLAERYLDRAYAETDL